MSLLQNSNAISSGGYNLTDSVRFRSASAGYLTRTPSSAGNRKTWTYSVWFKIGTQSGYRFLLSAGTNVVADMLCYIHPTSHYLYWANRVSSFNAVKHTTQVFRDSSAWYHLVLVWDTSNSTASDRMRIYINNERVTSFVTSTDPALNLDSIWNNNVANNIGCDTILGTATWDGYMSEINFVDGQALTATDFGEYDTDTGVWKPKKYIGSYGTNGFHLPMKNNFSGLSADVLIVSGGGGGGGAADWRNYSAGGGGAGGMKTLSTSFITGSSYTVTVGAGGAGAPLNGPYDANGGAYGSQGSSSSVVGLGISQSTTGGGRGGASSGNSGYPKNGGNGGSGGGGGGDGGTGGTAVSGEGFAGGTGSRQGAGGGGASAVGANASPSTPGGNGGAGLSNSYSGSAVTYAGGGGGAGSSWNAPATAGTGGSGGGGNGGSDTSTVGQNGTANLGGGGGATAKDNQPGGSGGSGIVIIRYPGSQVATGGTVTSVGGYTIHTFTGSGTFTA